MLSTLAISLTLALVLGLVSQRLKLSPLVGYLMAGMIVARSWMGGVDNATVEDFSHVGVVLLLFGVGLQFHFKDLLAVQKVALPGSCICMLLWCLAGGLICHAFAGESVGWAGSLMFGACLCISSTVVLTRVLEDTKLLHTPAGHTALGWLVVEDIFTIFLLVILPSIFGEQSLAPALGWLSVKLAALVFLVAFVGHKLMGKLFTHLARNSSGELFTLAVLAFALGIAVLSAYVFNASLEFGAFLSGMVVGQSRFAGRAASEALPLRDAFAVLFFVSVGMGFNPYSLLENWELALSATLFILLFKPLSAYFVIRLLRRPGSLGVVVGSALAQIGEFSFILAALSAGTYTILPQSVANVITGVAIISIILNAALYRFVPRLISAMERRGIGLPSLRDAHLPEESAERYRAIVVGYGPCGELLTRILQRYEMEVVVIEMNIDTVARLAAKGIPALHGDARLRTVLQMAGCEHAEALMITTPAAPAREIFDAARSLNPDIGVMGYTTYSSNARALRAEGAESVFSGEEEVALTLSNALLRRLGATEEQIAKQRREARALFQSSVSVQE